MTYLVTSPQWSASVILMTYLVTSPQWSASVILMTYLVVRHHNGLLWFTCDKQIHFGRPDDLYCHAVLAPCMRYNC
jgi:hypothetical protein